MHLEFLEVEAAFLPGRSHDVQEVWREHKGNPLLADSHETLVIAQDVAKVNVEEVSCRNTQRAKRVGFEMGNIQKVFLLLVSSDGRFHRSPAPRWILGLAPLVMTQSITVWM